MPRPSHSSWLDYSILVVRENSWLLFKLKNLSHFSNICHYSSSPWGNNLH
jgi:hypothetical protein